MGVYSVAESLGFLECGGRLNGFSLLFYTWCCVALSLFGVFNIYMGSFFCLLSGSA